MNDIDLPRTELSFTAKPTPTVLEIAAKAAIGILVAPISYLLAILLRLPGTTFHMRCAWLAMQSLIADRERPSARQLYDLVFRPLDTTRYFEFDTLWRWANSHPQMDYLLDVSSPRLFPILLLLQHSSMKARLANPHGEDFAITRALVSSLRLEERCEVLQLRAAELLFPQESFDVITCISVLEHIVDDQGALHTMWNLLRRGGRLLVTVPAKATAATQWINSNEYGLLEPDDRGFTFWQRLYDEGLLKARVFAVAGKPRRMSVYGERKPGILQANVYRKRTDPWYPFWLEPAWMATQFKTFPTVSSLPGEGVVALEFEKP